MRFGIFIAYYIPDRLFLLGVFMAGRAMEKCAKLFLVAEYEFLSEFETKF